MTDERDEIRARVDIVDLVSRRVALKRSGKGFTGLCPFHEDRNPSFFVDPRTGRYRCWSCGESGDIFTWVMKTQHLEFVDALQELASIAGVKLGRRSKAQTSNRETFRNAMGEALAFFAEQLPASPAAMEYCRRRELDAETVRTWELGFAPETGDPLAVRLKKAGISLADAKNLFLVDEDSTGGFYDRFRARLMFPIRDERGDLVAFGGRLLGDGNPKYINSSDTPLYRKSHVLYGMNRARDVMAKSKRAVLVEGYLDVIACHRSGVDTAIASLGTALSEEHAKLLKRWVQDVFILYDSDEAGRKAAERAIDILQNEGLHVRVALMPPGEDPDTLFRTSGPESVQKAVNRGVPPASFRISQLENRLNPSQDQFWQEAVAILAKSNQDLEIEAQVTRLAGLYPGIRDLSAASSRLRRMIASTRGDRPMTRKTQAKAAPEFQPLQEKLSGAEVALFAAFHRAEFRRAAWETILQRPAFFGTDAASEICRALTAAFPEAAPEGESKEWLHLVEPESTRQLLADVLADIVTEGLNEAVVADAIRALQSSAELRELRRLKSSETTPEQKREIVLRLKNLNPDPRNARQSESDLFA